MARGLVGCWLMNEGAGTLVFDASGNGRHITMSGMNGTSGGWITSTVGPALRFDYSNDYAITPANFPAFGLGDFTVAILFRADSVHHTNNCIVSQGTYNDGWIIYNFNDDWRFYIGGQYMTITAYESTSPEYSRLTWMFIGRANDQMFVYRDGLSAQFTGDSISGASVNMDATYGLRLGARGTSKAERFFDGDIAAVHFFHRALSAAEIASLYTDPYQMFRRGNPVILGGGASGANNYTFTINDGMGVSDDRSNLASLIRSVAEGLGLSDNASSVSSLLRTLSDAMGIEDAESASAAIVRGLNEAVGLTDAKSKLSVAVRQVADSIGLDDSIGCLSVLLRTISDAEGVTDGQVLGRMLVVADEIGAADEIGRVVAYLRTKSESVGLSDEMIEGATAAIAKTISDAMGLSDEAVRLSVVVRGVLDGIGIADAAQRLSVCLRVVTDSLGITDGTAMARAMSVAETMGLSSSWSKAVGYLRAQSDSMSLADDYASAWAVLRTIDETLGVTDQMIQEGVAVLVRIISDVVGATDSRSQVHEALRVLTASVATSDSVARLFAVSRVIAEVEGLTDVASRGRFYMIADTLGVSDEVARLVGFLRSCDEGVGVIEAILRVSGVVRRLDDSMGVTDSEQHFLSGLVQAAMAFLILRKGR